MELGIKKEERFSVVLAFIFLGLFILFLFFLFCFSKKKYVSVPCQIVEENPLCQMDNTIDTIVGKSILPSGAIVVLMQNYTQPSDNIRVEKSIYYLSEFK